MKIRLRHDLGVCEGYLSAKAGDIIEVSESSAVRYIKLGYAEAVTKGQAVVASVETAVAQDKNIETATASVPASAPIVQPDIPKPLDEGEDSVIAKPKSAAATATRRR